MVFIKRITSIPLIFSVILCLVFILPFCLYTIYRIHQSHLKTFRMVERDFQGYMEWRLKKHHGNLLYLLEQRKTDKTTEAVETMNRTLITVSSATRTLLERVSSPEIVPTFAELQFSLPAYLKNRQGDIISWSKGSGPDHFAPPPLSQPHKQQIVEKAYQYIEKPVISGFRVGVILEKSQIIDSVRTDFLSLLEQLNHPDSYHFIINANGKFVFNEQMLFPGRRIAPDEAKKNADTLLKKLVGIQENKNDELIRFTWSLPNDGQVERQKKIIFATFVPDFGWTIGTAVNIQEYATYLMENHSLLLKKTNQEILTMVTGLILLFIFMMLIGHLFSRKLKLEFSVFIDFFHRSGDADALIEADKLYFHEFRRMGKVANDILKKRQRQTKIISAYMAKLKESNQALRKMADRDGLTGVASRRYFDTSLEKSWKDALRHREPLTIGMLDIDYFKQYNDTFGHQKGDQCLILFAETIEKSMKRPYDLVARYGGEEFVTIFPDTDSDGAMEIAYRIHEAVSALNIRHETAVSTRLTFSMGIATLIPSSGLSPETLVLMADSALYKAKRQGRNQIVIYREDMEIISSET